MRMFFPASNRVIPTTLLAGLLCAASTNASVIETGEVLVDASGQLVIGSSGVGELTVNGGDTRDHDGNVILARFGGATGTVNVDGVGSHLNATAGLIPGALIIGNGEVTAEGGIPNAQTNGVVNVSGGGRVTADATFLGVFNGGPNGLSSGTINLSGSTSVLQVAELNIGELGSGQFTMTDGTVFATRTRVGNGGGSQGQVDMSGGVFNAGGSLNVGHEGLGEFNMSAGIINSAFASVGREGGSEGTMHVSGLGTVINLSGTPTDGGFLNVARQGGSKGTLTLTDGALLQITSQPGIGSQGGFQIGRNANSDGAMTVSNGAQVLVDGPIPFVHIGRAGKGTLNVDGGSVEITGTQPGTFFQPSVGRDAGADGTLNISNNGSFVVEGSGGSVASFAIGLAGVGVAAVSTGGELRVAGATHVGQEAGADGTLELSGGTVEVDNLDVATLAGSTGSLDISGGTLNSGRDVFIGNDGAGALTMSGGILNAANAFNVGQSGMGVADVTGGTVNAAFASVARNDNSTGTLNVSGAATVINLDGNNTFGGFLNVARGAGSDAELHISDGAMLNITEQAGAFDGGFQVARNAGSIGVMTVSGGAQVSVETAIPFVHIGRAGEGTLTITDGGSVSVTGTQGGSVFQPSVGREAGSKGVLNVASGGSFNLNNGGSEASFALGLLAGSNGMANVDAGGSINIAGTMHVGLSGDGTLNLNGGSVHTHSLVIGNLAGATGVVNQSGGTLNLAPGRGLNVGLGATGTFNLSGGVVNAGFASVGRNAGAVGHMEITGAGTALNLTGDGAAGGFLNVSRGGGSSGELHVSDNAVLNITAAPGVDFAGFQIARNSGAHGEMRVANGAEVNVTGQLPFVHIGRSDVGVLEVDNASVRITGTNGVDYQTTVGRQAGGDGKLIISNGGSFTLAGEGGAKATQVLGRDAGSRGEIHVISGGLLDIDGRLEIAGAGTGFVSVRDGGMLVADQVMVNAGGRLGGDGTVTANVNVAGGIVGPGNSPGTLTIIGDLIVDSGVLELEIGDLLNVTGLVSIGADVQVHLFLEDFLPLQPIDLADFFILSQPVFDAGFSGLNIDVFSTSDAVIGSDVQVAFAGQTVDITAGRGSVASAPASFALLGAGLVVLVVQRRRSRVQVV